MTAKKKSKASDAAAIEARQKLISDFAEAVMAVHMLMLKYNLTDDASLCKKYEAEHTVQVAEMKRLDAALMEAMS